MKIIELIEQTIGTVGSTSGQATSINPVSNQPSDKPASATSPMSANTSTNATNTKPLDNLLKQNQINVKSTDDFLRAFDAIQQKTELSKLPPEQQRAISDYTKATINKPNLPTQMTGIMKTMMTSKPTSNIK